MRMKPVAWVMMAALARFPPGALGFLAARLQPRVMIRRDLVAAMASSSDQVHVVGQPKSVGKGAKAAYSLEGAAAHSGLPAVPPGATFTVRSDGVVLGEALASQHEIHEEFGGVVPGLARDAHQKNVDAVIGTALAKAGMRAEDLDAVAVTLGPGLEICLRVGANAARELARAHELPFVAVHHLEVAAEEEMLPEHQVEFPFLALLVSGGHCQILLCHGVANYTVLGGTLDDALGEAYDKAARMLGLRTAGAGGPAVEALARQGDPHAVPLPVPMQKRKDCDFSYAGLKNAFRLAVEQARDAEGLDPNSEDRGAGEGGRVDGAGSALSEGARADLAASFQRVAIRHLEDRLKRALDWVNTVYPSSTPSSSSAAPSDINAATGIGDVEDALENPLDMTDPLEVAKVRAAMEAAALAGQVGSSGQNDVVVVRDLAVVGGVAANQAVRAALKGICESRDPPWRLVAPPPRLCTDNGVMVAWAAVEKLKLGFSDPIDPPNPRRDVKARWPIGRFADKVPGK